MTSEFGGDIFGDDPPAATPPKKGGGKGRSPSVQKVNLKSPVRREADDDLTFATQPPPAPGATDDSPRRGRSEPPATDEPAAPRSRDRDEGGGGRGRGRGRRGRGERQPDAPRPADDTTPAAGGREPRHERPGRGTPVAKDELADDFDVADEIEAGRDDEALTEALELVGDLDADEDDDDEIEVIEEIEEVIEETFAEPDVALPVSLDDDDDVELFEPSAPEVRGTPVADQEDRGPGAAPGGGSGRRRRRRRGRDRDRDRDRGPETVGDRPRDERSPAPPPRAVPVVGRPFGDRPPVDRPAGDRPADRPAERHGRPARAPAWTPAAPGSSPRPTTPTQRVALFVDVEALQREAHPLGGQVSFSRLLRLVAGPRTLSRAIAYCTPQSRGTGGVAGLETVKVANEAETPVAIAVDALATAPRVDCVVIAPEALAVAPLVRALRAAGVRVESAGFDSRGPSEVADHQRLGQETLFAP